MRQRERIEATPRRAMTPARRRAIYDRQNGLCDCGAPLLKGWIADHSTPLFYGGADELSNLVGRCPPCDAVKTPADLRAIAKVRRIIRKQEPLNPDAPAKGRRLAPRGFDRRLRKKMDGTVVSR